MKDIFTQHSSSLPPAASPGQHAPSPQSPVPSHETIDDLREYNLRIIQPKSGYRFSVDPLLLCRFAGPVDGRIIDLGTGSGVMSLIMARLSEQSQVVGVEVEQRTAALARRNVHLNEFDGRVEIVTADILHLKQRFPVSTFDLVLANPPYRPRGAGRISQIPGRDTARHESTALLADFLTVAKYLVRPSGRICFIYHVSRLAELVAEASALKLSLLRLQFVHGSAGDEARMVMLELAKGRSRELSVLPPLFVT
jgi:tRNA1Val (adenine37-N6)-methyltransferase